MKKLKFTTILWDVDGTLLDFLYAQRIAIKMCCEKYGQSVTDDEIQKYSNINDYYWKQFELGNISKPDLLVARFQTWFETCGIQNISASDFNDAYEEALGGVFSYIDDSPTICSILKDRGIHQYVVTNGSYPTASAKLKNSGIGALMDDVFISDSIGAPKPKKEFFDYCMERIPEKDKNSILLVGDSLSSDIKGGILYGIPTCWYRKPGTENSTEYQPMFEIEDLHEIFDILEIRDVQER